MENPYFQYFCGEEFFQHRLVFDRSSLTRWRQRMGEDKLLALLQESLAVAARTEAAKPSDLARVVIGTTVQPKAVMFPTDAKLINRARERLVRLANRWGVDLRQSYRRVGKLALQRYALTTVRDGARQAPDLVDRNFTANRPNMALLGLRLTLLRIGVSQKFNFPTTPASRITIWLLD